MASREEAEHYLREMHAKRGYTLDLHRYMALADLEWSKKYGEFLDETYYKQRSLDRKTKELLQVVVEAALGADVPHIQAHVHLALEHGATSQEVLEALECVVAPMGVLAFRRGVAAWAAEAGLEPVPAVQT
jgi:4-carboxymuconolactone decarboxylase